MNDKHRLPQAPGEEIRKRLHDRGWTQADLAKVLGRPLPTVNEIIQGKKSITPEMAIALGAAFNTNPKKWLELESAYRLSLVRFDADPVQKRAYLYNIAPIKDMKRRHWIGEGENLDDLEGEICRFFEIGSLNEEPRINAAARDSIKAQFLPPAQKAWCFRARHLARVLQVSQFNRDNLQQAEVCLRKLAAYPENARHVSRTLADFGIRFLVIEPLYGSKIDGATIWLDENSPIIAVSIRYDRIDAFWFTLMHEFAHVRHKDASIDTNLVGGEQMPSIAKEDAERKADEKAASTLVPSQKLDSFIIRVGPLYSKARIIQFAHRVKIHPGIIVGQLQYRGEIGYSANREMLVKIRDLVTNSAVTDGWGHIIATDIN